MKKPKINMAVVFIFIACLLSISKGTACTTVSAIAADGQVWTANNEDGPFGVANFINVFPRSDQAVYGYYTLSYLSPKYGEGSSIQGGMNEAGLTFDFNAISRVNNFDVSSKKAFPQGDDAILPHILASMDSVHEVIAFFDTYWFQSGFRTAQMHVADKYGNFAIISASGIKLAEKGHPLVSTNFDICGKEDGSSCWRYPIATKNLQSEGAGLSSMLAICRKTAQKNGSTMYSNVQNLTTGELWFFSKHDPDVLLHTTIVELLLKGRESYTFSNLQALLGNQPKDQEIEFTSMAGPFASLQDYTGTYQNSYVGKIYFQQQQGSLKLSFDDGFTAVLKPESSNTFFLVKENVIVKFIFDDAEKKVTFYENGLWAFSAWKVD